MPKIKIVKSRRIKKLNKALAYHRMGLNWRNEFMELKDYYKPPLNDSALTDICTGLPCSGCRNRDKCNICIRRAEGKEGYNEKQNN